jgi:hypothetical protein
VLSRLHRDYSTTGRKKEGFAAVLGGLMSGAVGGLAADVAAGGLTLGGGMLVGGILGALGAGGLARGYNIVKGEVDPSVRWSDELFQSLVCAALIRYLAVAHFGRGRGDWEEGEHPPFWHDAINAVLEDRRDDIRAIVRRGRAGEEDQLAGELEALLSQCAARLLTDIYSEAARLFPAGDLLPPKPTTPRQPRASDFLTGREGPLMR